MNTALRSTDMDIDLSRFDKAAIQSEPKPKQQYADLPDGRYEVRIEDVELYKSPNSGNPVLKYTMRVLGPTHADRMLWKRSAITDRTRDYVFDDLRLCGLELEKFSDLKFHLHDLIGVELEVTRRTKENNVNVYFNSTLDARASRQEQEEDDDLPF